MKKRLCILGWVLLVSLSSLTNSVHAQRSIGKVEPEIKEDREVSEDVLDIPVEQWIGKRFIFLEKSKSSQKSGYKLYSDKKRYKELEYDKFVGKIIKVVNVERAKYSRNNYDVTFVEEESDKKIYAETCEGHMEGIAFFDDMAKAKERWLGKTIYFKSSLAQAVRKTIETYDEELDKYGEIKVKIGDPLKVLDIWWGIDDFNSLWMIVETTEGEKGFISTAFSWTNICSEEWTENRPWENEFFEFNPKEKYSWSDEVWEMMNNGEVRVGMNKEQVELSWGKPEKINKDISEGLILEQWIYSSQYLYFDVTDKLTDIQSF